MYDTAGGRNDPTLPGQPDPGRFDIARQPNAHLAFSTGIHVCLGAALARLEAQSAILGLVQRMPRLALTGEALEWQSAGRFRGLKALPVAI